MRRGGKVVFADLDPKTLNIDPESVEAKIGPRTRAIYVVHYSGLAVDMDPVLALGEGGMLTFSRDDWEEKTRLLRWVGMKECVGRGEILVAVSL